MRGTSVDTDRVLVAAWLSFDGEHAAANALLNSVTAFHEAEVNAAMRAIIDLIGERDDLAGRRHMLDGDVKAYIDQFEDDRPRGDWPGYRETELERLDGDISLIELQMRSHAGTIAAFASERAA